MSKRPKYLRNLDEPVLLHGGMERVRQWSVKLHGAASDRHAWCVATAAAIVDENPLPPAGKGTPFTRESTAEARRETIRNLLAGRQA